MAKQNLFTITILETDSFIVASLSRVLHILRVHFCRGDSNWTLKSHRVSLSLCYHIRSTKPPDYFATSLSLIFSRSNPRLIFLLKSWKLQALHSSQQLWFLFSRVPAFHFYVITVCFTSIVVSLFHSCYKRGKQTNVSSRLILLSRFPTCFTWRYQNPVQVSIRFCFKTSNLHSEIYMEVY